MRRALVSLMLLLSCSGCSFALRALARSLAVPAEPKHVEHKLHDAHRPDAGLSVLWIGHATALVQLDDKFVLTDPVFTSSVGGISRRLVEPGFDAADLPQLAAAVVSHTHLDHFSFDSLAMIEQKTKHVFLPQGARDNLPRYAFESHELARWQSFEADGVRITAVPVRHVGGRFGLDLAWGPKSFTGYVFEYHGLSVYFGGDTAFDVEIFQSARERFPALDLAILPICPIEPREYMKIVHMDPIEALDAFELLGAKRMVPIHFDTFINSADVPGECPRALLHETARRKLPADTIEILEIGEQRVLVPRVSAR
ncbi:MAG TPA: MBL fold metallo-hydrolase [Polyangiales bacterium]|nr:MBL fold metallo-hydrolase [Polyangiales bacterium]